MSNALIRIQAAMASHHRHYGHEAQQLVIGGREWYRVLEALGDCHRYPFAGPGDGLMGLEVVRDMDPEVCYLVSRGQRGELYVSAT